MKDNEIIAEFMGMEDYQEMGEYVTPNYDSDWNELMKVVDKIEEDEKYDVMILQYGTIIRNQRGVDIVNNVANISFDNKREHTYQALIEFIKQHNQNK